MSDDADFSQFAENFRQEVINNAEGGNDNGGASFREDEFTRLMVEYLTEAGEIEDGHICYHSARGIKVNGYSILEEEDCLDLFVSIYTQSIPPVTVRKDEVEAAFRRLLVFLQQAVKGYHKSIEEASCVFDMAQLIYKLKHQLSRVRLFLFTDGLTTVKHKQNLVKDGITYSFNIWDIQRTYRCVTSGQQREAIEINFQSQYGFPIPCLPMPESNIDYNACLAIIPGEILCKLYEEYGSRLLERNVRSFLQVRGKVNKGIRQTILKEPHRFLAYNNGISATAEEVRFVELPDGGQGIIWLRDLQIVNGGQTTASIYQAARKDKADISKIYVQAKLTIVAPEQVDEIVPLISRYANNQNKVSEADFSANDPFHVKIEEFSRTVWAPAVDGTQRQTRWFYERARGQYLNAKGRESTLAKQRAFTAMHPVGQKFTKTDLAKFEQTWEQLPHIVSLGAQKNFCRFTLRIAERDGVEIDENYFKRLIAKAILFRGTEKIVQKEEFGGYRANIVTYTLSYLSYRAEQDVDLYLIWRQQSIPEALEQSIVMISRRVHHAITNPPDGRNVTEWCKKEACWKSIKTISIELPFKGLNGNH
ncbi:AIPR family protein [Oscillatoria sp. FACHB-1407]|uniref:AIPR family protein n=1 Tax=Oscillatoria sp. FACHB-1407 TaxID=2692847 RepID=UPI001683C400|nr:AIPR family protein [Oscillatoria sp. FACHB-1407]MBD2465604.1 AIPR family protein [Oscillatoria sp. FACHB-1407]